MPERTRKGFFLDWLAAFQFLKNTVFFAANQEKRGRYIGGNGRNFHLREAKKICEGTLLSPAHSAGAFTCSRAMAAACHTPCPAGLWISCPSRIPA